MLLKHKKLIAVGVETTKGTALSTGLTQVIGYDIKCKHESGKTERKISGKAGGHTGKSLDDGLLKGTLKFKTELHTTGTQQWSPGLLILMQGCGLLATGQALTPTTAIADQKSLTMWVYEDGRCKKLYGCAGNYTFTPDGNKIAIEFDFTGIWAGVSDLAVPTVALPATIPLPWSASGNSFTFNSVVSYLSKFSFTGGNVVSPRMYLGAPVHYFISDRSPELSGDPEAKLVATNALHAAELADTQFAATLVIGNGTDKFTLTGTYFQLDDIEDGERENLLTDEFKGKYTTQNPSAGDNEYSMTIAAP